MIPSQSRPVATLVLCAVTCLTLAMVAGVAGTLAYSEDFDSLAGLTFQHIRPLHTTYAVAWIYLAGCAVVYAFLFSQPGERSRSFRLRLKAQLVLWGLAGLGLLITLSTGIFSGREYIAGHWIWSVLVYLGWILFAWNFFSVVGFSLKGKPAFLYMWATSMFLFLYTFAEGHGWLLAIVSDYPLRDMAIQWKSYGPLVGSFNLLVYGSMGYLACCIAGNDRGAHSRTAFALFFIGVLNTFTNFGHHTYHLPQSHLVKWISFVISMLEGLFVAKFLWDIAVLLKNRPANPAPAGVGFLMRAALVWSFLLVGISVLISIPQLNTLIHGTHFVMGHAMGMMLGIDSVALWACLLYLIQKMVPENHRLHSPRASIPIFWVINLAILGIISLLSVKGLLTGYYRYLGPAAPAPPDFLAYFPEAFMVLGSLLGLALLHLNVSWARALIPLLPKNRMTDSHMPAQHPRPGLAGESSTLPGEKLLK